MTENSSRQVRGRPIMARIQKELSRKYPQYQGVWHRVKLLKTLVENYIVMISRISRILEGDRAAIKVRFKMPEIAELEYRGR